MNRHFRETSIRNDGGTHSDAFNAKFAFVSICMTIRGTMLYKPNLPKLMGFITPLSVKVDKGIKMCFFHI